MNVRIETLSTGETMLQLDKEKSSDGAVLKNIAKVLKGNQYGSMTLQGRLCTVYVPIRLIPLPPTKA